LLPRLTGRVRDELAGYLRRGGVSPPGPALADDPYERALAQLDAGEEPGDPLRALQRPGAEPGAARGGVRLPRAPPPGHPGRPAAQLDLLARRIEGRTNAEIAERLDVSVRTVAHPVAAVLEKLGVHSRREAGEAARRLGLR